MDVDASQVDGSDMVDGGHLGLTRAAYVAPHVLFSDAAQAVRIFGTGLAAASSDDVFVDDRLVGTLEAASDREGLVRLPALSPGEHFLQIGAPSTTAARGARLFVAVRAAFPDAQVELPRGITALIFDEERRAFFATFSDKASKRSFMARVRFEGDHWQVEALGNVVPAPIDLTMTPDGRTLLVLNAFCVLQRLDPDALEVSTSTYLTGCAGEFREVQAMADGRTVLCRPDQTPNLVYYPGFQPVQDVALHSTLGVISRYQTRSIWADGPTPLLVAHPLYVHDVGEEGLSVESLPGGEARAGMAISGDGARFALHGEIYDADFEHLGALEASAGKPWRLALSGDGRVAVAYAPERQSLRAYDVGGSRGPFPPIAADVPLPDISLDRLEVDDAGEFAFVFASHDGVSQLLVRRVR